MAKRCILCNKYHFENSSVCEQPLCKERHRLIANQAASVAANAVLDSPLISRWIPRNAVTALPEPRNNVKLMVIKLKDAYQFGDFLDGKFRLALSDYVREEWPEVLPMDIERYMVLEEGEDNE